jgi:hypothetical protein
MPVGGRAASLFSNFKQVRREIRQKRKTKKQKKNAQSFSPPVPFLQKRKKTPRPATSPARKKKNA